MESISQATEDLPAESADDERDDDLESEDEVDQDENEVVDPLCTAIAKCVANSGDHRKVVSHIFGRNKICTSQIPSECWIFYCRKHYQRHRFRAKETGWKRTQFDIIKRQLARLETWGGVIDWEIALRKKEREELAIANRHALLNNTQPTYRESFLEPYLGSGKSFQEVNQVLQVIETETMSTNAKDLPGFELLPKIDKKLHPPNKATRKPQKPKADAHVAKSTTTTKRKRAVSASAKLPTADAKPASKRRRLVQASSTTDAATASLLEDTNTNSPTPSTVLGFRSVNQSQQTLPMRPARRNSKEKELASAEDSHFADISEGS